MTQYTENYRLELYEGTDKADLTDQYNVSMGILDGAMKGVVDDTDASVAGIRADLATTNSNLNATNINLQALDTREAEHHAASTESDSQLQTQIDTLKATVDAVPETYATQVALEALDTREAEHHAASTESDSQLQTQIDTLKATVDENTPLVEEHVNYFAQLGVTDEQSATDLHTQIDNTYQGVMENTQSIQALQNSSDLIVRPITIAKLNEEATVNTQFFVGSKNKDKIGLMLVMHHNVPVNVNLTFNLTPVPGNETYYGFKLNIADQIADLLPENAKGRYFSCVGLKYVYWWTTQTVPSQKPHTQSMRFPYMLQQIGYCVGTDGDVYVLVQREREFDSKNGYRLILFNFINQGYQPDDGHRSSELVFGIDLNEAGDEL